MRGRLLAAAGLLAAVIPAPHDAQAAPEPKESFRGTRVTSAKPAQRAVKPPAKPRAAGESHVVIDVLDRQGAPAARAKAVHLDPLEGGEPLSLGLDHGHAEGRLPAGDYAVHTDVVTPDPGGGESDALIYLPNVSLAKDRTLVLDARKAEPVTVTVDGQPDARVTSASIHVSQKLGGGNRVEAWTDGADLYVTPTGTSSDVTYRVQARLTRNGAEMGSPYVYNLAAAQTGVPNDPGLHVNERSLAKVTVHYMDQGGESACAGGHEGVDWGIGFTINLWEAAGKVPTSRTEYFTPGLHWTSDVGITDSGCGFAWSDTDSAGRDDVFPGPGDYTRRWRAAPIGPSAGAIYLEDARSILSVPMLTEQGTAGNDAPYPHTTGTTTLRDANGVVVETSDQPGQADYWRRPAPGRYELTVDAKRTSPRSDLATREHVVWNLDIKDAQEVDVPAIRHRTSLGDDNRALPNTLQTIMLVPERMDKSTSTDPSLQVSYDDGRTWHRVAVRDHGAEWEASITNPASGYVSLRTVVPGVLDQTVIRAYGIR